MVTFVSACVSSAVAEWGAEFAAAAAEAGIESMWSPGAQEFGDNYPIPRPDATVADVVAHCEHIREVAGIDHIGLGGDYDGTTWLPVDLPDVSGYPRLSAALAERGWSDDDLAKLGWRNAIDTFARVRECAGSS